MKTSFFPLTCFVIFVRNLTDKLVQMYEQMQLYWSAYSFVLKNYIFLFFLFFHVRSNELRTNFLLERSTKQTFDDEVRGACSGADKPVDSSSLVYVFHLFLFSSCSVCCSRLEVCCESSAAHLLSCKTTSLRREVSYLSSPLYSGSRLVERNDFHLKEIVVHIAKICIRSLSSF